MEWTDEEISSAFLWREKKREEKKRGEEEEGKKGALVMSAGETLENVDFSFEELDEHDGFDVKEFYYSTICEWEILFVLVSEIWIDF